MPQVSRRFLNQKTHEKVLSLFLFGIIHCKSKEAALSFLDDLLTPTEKTMLSKRFSIAYMLLKGYDYDSICDILKVSRATIGTVALWLKTKGNGFREVIETIGHSESSQKIFEEIQDMFEETIANMRGQNWSRSKRQLWENRRHRQQPF